MTVSHPTTATHQPSYFGFRLAILLFAVLLGAQCVWLLLAEFSRPGIAALPTDATVAAVAANQRDAAHLAALVGAIRGDLWAESGFTYADLLFDQTGAMANPDLAATVARGRLSLNHAVNYAPHRSSAWLLLAGLALRYPSSNMDAGEALKMSYYTGPSEQILMPLRLRIAMRTENFSDIEMRDLVSRELRLLLTRKQNSAIAEAYDIASPAGKHLIEQTVGSVDPSFVNTLRASGASKNFPH